MCASAIKNVYVNFKMTHKYCFQNCCFFVYHKYVCKNLGKRKMAKI